MKKYIGDLEQVRVCQKIVYMADSSNEQSVFYDCLSREYPIVYQPIQDNLDLFLILEQTTVLCIIEMIRFSENSRKLIGAIRRKTNMPILYISKTNLDVKRKEENRFAIESGADEYWGCSMDIEEKMLRLKALIRLQNRIRETSTIWYFQKLQIVLGSRQVFCGEIEIILTKIEFDIICFLAQQNGRVVTYKELYEAVWNREYLRDDANIMAHIHRIRQKIEKDIKKPEYIQNVYGVGYRFGEFAQEVS